MLTTRGHICNITLGVLALCALLISPLSVSAASLDITDLVASYTVHDPSSTKGTLDFNIRFNSRDGDIGLYDYFSTQVIIRRLTAGASSAQFLLDENVTENTGAIGMDYWLANAPTGNQNASTQGSEFRFSDFIAFNQGVTPATGDVVAHFSFSFDLTAADQFGSYEVVAGDSSQNHFRSDLVNTFDTTTTPALFDIVVPEPATCLLLGFSFFAMRRRRR